MNLPKRPIHNKQEDRGSEIYLRAFATAVLARQLCLVVGVILVLIGLGNLLALLSLHPITGGTCLLSGVGLLQWVGSGAPQLTDSAKTVV